MGIHKDRDTRNCIEKFVNGFNFPFSCDLGDFSFLFIASHPGVIAEKATTDNESSIRLTFFDAFIQKRYESWSVWKHGHV
jgi:hypothetical protein